jgi:hypothetical protein
VTDAQLDAGNVDDLGRTLMALVSEVWILRDRMLVMEQLLQERAGISAEEIDDYAGNAAFKAGVERQRDRFVANVIGAPLAARERSVEQILARAGLGPKKLST